MLIKNTEDRFGIVTILFHWIMAILLIGLVSVGLYMSDLPIGVQKLKLYGLHKEFGILALMLVMLRVVWRIQNMNPSLSSLPWFERTAARIVHWAFYGFMFALPISGWLMTSAANLPPSFFGLFLLPALVPPNQEQMHLFQQIHEYLAYGLIVTFCLHVLAALKHHFIDKDNILRRILS